MACGKVSPHKYGGEGASRGWDVSCAMNATLHKLDSLLRGESGTVIGFKSTPKEVEEESGGKAEP